MSTRLPRQVALVLIAGLVLSFVASSPVWAQESGRLVATVTDASGTALPGVMVVATRGALSRDRVTDLDGRASVDGLPPGDYDLTTTLSGFRPDRRSVRVTGGTSSTVAVSLVVEFLEQVLVTAERTGARDLQATPMAVTALTRDDLVRAQAANVGDIAGRAPSVTFSQNTGLAQLTIRGIGTNAVFAGADPSSAIYLDGVYLARPAMSMADFTGLERAEVLRGPQGTLYGRNSVGGAVNLITSDPTNVGEAAVRVTAGSLRTLRVNARASGPLIEDRIMGSVALGRAVSRGFVNDLNHPDQPLGGEDRTTMRGKLLVTLNGRTSIMLAADRSHSDARPLIYAKVLSVKPGFQIDNPPGLHQVRTSLSATGRQLHRGAFARLTMHAPNRITLVSLTAYRALDYDVTVDSDITELDLAVTHVKEIHHQWSQEVTVSGQGAKATWIGGLYLFRDVDRQPTSIELRGPRIENRVEPEVKSRATAAFAQTTVTLLPRISATAGVRYTRERKTIDNVGQSLILGTAQAIGAFAYNDAVAFDAWTPKVAIETRIGDTALTYVSATRGFKSGGFNASSTASGRGYAPEWVWSFETGIKAALAGGRMRLNVAAFQMAYTDLQVQTQIRPGVLDISNAAAATIRGIEIEGGVRAGQSLRLGGHLAWLDAVYDHYLAAGPGGTFVQAAGHRLSNAPQWSGRVWAEWVLNAGRAGSLSTRLDARRQSIVFFSPLNDLVQRQPAHGVVDLSIRLGHPRRSWTLEGVAGNLTNAEYITGTFSSPPPAIGGRPAEPRRISVVLEVRK